MSNQKFLLLINGLYKFRILTCRLGMVTGRFQNNGMHYNKSTNAAELNPRKLCSQIKKFWSNQFSFNLKNRLFCLDIDSWKYSRTNQKIGQILLHLWTWQHISMPAHQTPFRERLKSCHKNHQINIIFWRIRKRKKSLNQWSAHVLLEVLQQMIW